jgi:hypothetical protein
MSCHGGGDSSPRLLLDLLMEKLALDPTWVKNHSCYDELKTYGAIAA